MSVQNADLRARALARMGQPAAGTARDSIEESFRSTFSRTDRRIDSVCKLGRSKRGVDLRFSTRAFFEVLDLGHICCDATSVLALPRAVAALCLGNVMVLRHVTLLCFFVLLKNDLAEKGTAQLKESATRSRVFLTAGEPPQCEVRAFSEGRGHRGSPHPHVVRDLAHKVRRR